MIFDAPRLTRRLAAALSLLAAACRGGSPNGPARFERMDPGRTGVAFANTLPDRPDFDIISYLYYYNGGGVAVADFDANGYQDLYFSSSAGSNRLYLNQGGWRFVDATARAGVADSVGWKTGVAAADVNGDGRPDLYASGVDYLGMRGRNVLYVNNGDGTFSDRTAESGLAFAGYATQALFFDYDGDGDLDCFLLTHLTASERKIGGGPAGDPRHPRAGGLLFRNDGAPNGSPPGAVPRFTDVTAAAGITGVERYGLGVVASDVNGDGRPDLYLASDFQGDDRLLVNQGDGTFRDEIRRATGHTSRFSMGVDAADVDDDGRPDVFVADMMPEREDVLKSSMSTESFALFNTRLRAGYHPQYARNTLQLNRGAGAADSSRVPVPRFADAAYLAGVDATDWSWAPLFADLDDDGRKDLFVTNGILRRPNDLDYINYVGNEAVQAALQRGDTAATRAAVARMPSVALANHAFRNEGGLAFRDRAAEWGLGEAGFSNGAAYADLDNDGALDLVVNRLNAPALVYRNRGRDAAFLRALGDSARPNGSLTLTLRGDAPNTAGIGARVWVAAGGRTQYLEQSPTRGFLSSVDPRLHVGLGRAAVADSLTVAWPDGRRQTLRGVRADSRLTLVQGEVVRGAACGGGEGEGNGGTMGSRFRGNDGAAGGRGSNGLTSCRPRESGDPRSRLTSTPALLADATATAGPDLGGFVHRENEFLDSDVQPLMPRLLSREGPALAAGDVDGDGRDDLYVGGAKWQPGRLLLQQPDGAFRARAEPALAADSLAEDVDAAFLDADGDGDRDLVVAGGGNEFFGAMAPLAPRLYLNDGGRFRAAPNALAGVHVDAAVVAPADYDGDGDTDLFVGGRVVARRYGEPARSVLLRNDGRGPDGAPRFTDVTAQAAPALVRPGMVTGAAWVGAQGRGRRPELVVVGEWMPVRVFRPAAGGRLAEQTAAAGLAGTAGWWQTVTAADVTGDGRPDLVLGNFGRNGYVRASPAEPARLTVGDFAGNGALLQVLTHYKGGVSYPVAGRDDLVRLVPALRAKFPSYASFGASTLQQIFPAEVLAKAAVLEARTLESAVAVADGRGGYTLRPLPVEAQLAPVRAALAGDVDGDGRADLLLAGNDHGWPPVYGRQDAGEGLLLRGRGDGTFAPVAPAGAAALLPGEVRRMAAVRSSAGRTLLVATRNNATPVVLRLPGAPAAGPAGPAVLAARR